MTLAAETRSEVDARPFLREALRAGVVNYSAAARFLDVGDGDVEAVVAALRRYADDLPTYDTADRTARVTMHSGLGRGDPTDALVVVGDVALVPDTGSLTAVQATGAVDVTALAHVLGRLDAADVPVELAAVSDSEATDVTAAETEGVLVVVVPRRAGAQVLRVVEEALSSVPVAP